MHAGLETQYRVEVLKNIKGELSGTVTVEQAGGVEGEKIVAMEGDVEAAARDGAASPLLQVGSTYVLATRGDGSDGYYELGTNPYAKKLLSADSSLNTAALVVLSEKDSRVSALQLAYPNESPMKEDVFRGTLHNSFSSLPPDKKAATQARADEARAWLESHGKETPTATQ